ncbi:aminoacyl-histidine dipeptidase [Mogibacterium timidum]|uniref:Cytosol non-specific dipeptidase n=1 Tax=Mogibacterium timidum TaxID=35519 RepID=A0A7Y8VRH6_9FIRM|nr:aminoacyl-histidine dipeptidase [Mogibacterium timidum]NWO23214.1 aminoacyl-histidine dipeptidase [Mogibacterium timidum]
MSDVSMLAPQEVFKYFKEISDVPRASRHNEKISAYLVKFAREHGLEYYQDEALNVIIWKDGTHGYEDSDMVMIQGHMDIVAEKTEDSAHDFENDPLELMIDGDYITAKDTTLGADDGIAIAMGLAILDSTDIPHPPIELIVTVDEEIGMLGANALDGSKIRSRKIINLDSEEEGIITVGCAGAVDVTTHFPARRQLAKGIKYKYVVEGLLGGHSGSDIHLERANAGSIAARMLLEAREAVQLNILSIAGGRATNVILGKVAGEVIVAASDAKAFEESIAATTAAVKEEYRTSDPGIRVAVEAVGETEEEAIDTACQDNFLKFVLACPAGAQHYSVELENLVETSHSIGVVQLEGDELITRSMARSSVNSRKDLLTRKITIIAEALGATVEFSGAYGAWEFDNKSDLLDVCIKAYEEQYGEKPVVSAIHAGVECGKWAEKVGKIDAVSIGPDMSGVHSVLEKLSISSTERTWEYVKLVLAHCK